jgi:Sap, sulfolipid-1-addressing protein
MGAVLVLALMAAIDPVRLSIAALLISRPRPLGNLLAYWLGAMAANSAAAVGLLILLHGFAPMFMQTVSAAAASPTGRHTRIAIGVLALPFAAVIAVGYSARRARAPMAGDDPSALAPRPSAPTAISRLLGRAQGVLEGGSLWVAFVAGLASGLPPVEYLVALAAIAASGAAVGNQVTVAIAYIVVALAVFEIPLVSYLTAPAQTQRVVLQLHNWVRFRRRRILAVMVAVAGVVLMASGMGSA